MLELLPLEIINEIVWLVDKEYLTIVSEVCQVFYELTAQRITRIRNIDDYCMAINNNDILSIIRHRGKHWYDEGVTKTIINGHRMLFNMMTARLNIFQSREMILDYDVHQKIEQACEHNTLDLIISVHPLATWDYDEVCFGLLGAITANNYALANMLMTRLKDADASIDIFATLLMRQAYCVNDSSMIQLLTTRFNSLPVDRALGALKANNWTVFQEIVATLDAEAIRDYILHNATNILVYDNRVTELCLLVDQFPINWRSILVSAIDCNNYELVMLALRRPEIALFNCNRYMQVAAVVKDLRILQLLITNCGSGLSRGMLYELLEKAEYYCYDGVTAYLWTLIVLRIEY